MGVNFWQSFLLLWFAIGLAVSIVLGINRAVEFVADWRGVRVESGVVTTGIVFCLMLSLVLAGAISDATTDTEIKINTKYFYSVIGR